MAGECGGSPASILGVERISWLEEEARRLLGCDPAHGWPHIMRVAGWASRIVRGEPVRVDKLILYTALVLHDVGRSVPGEHHAVASARIAESLLSSRGLESIAGPVVHAILAHSYSLGVRAETAEARVLSDADKLDALGAVGIARVFHVGCQLGRGFGESLSHFHEKILRLPGLLYYDYSRRVAEQLASRVRLFIEWWSGEVPG